MRKNNKIRFLKEIIEIGKIGKSHGVKGSVYCYLDNMTCLGQDFPPYLFILKEAETLPFFVEEVDEIEDDIYIVKFDEIKNKEEASAQLTNAKIFIKKEDLATYFVSLNILNETDDSEYLGYTIYDQNQNKAGQIVDIFDVNGSIVAKIDSKNEIFIPIHSDLILNKDSDNKILIVEIADGLLDLED